MHIHVLIAVWALLATASVVQSRRWFASEVGCWITQKKVPASWDEAQQRCEKHGAILASPLNTQLLNYMQTLINVHNHSAAYFLGIRANRSDDNQEVHYVSVEGKRLDAMPQDVYEAIEQLDIEKGDCLSMDRRGIQAVSCWDHLPYICYSNDTAECGIEPAPTSTPPAPSSTEPTTSSTTPPPTTTAPPGYTYKAATGSWYKYIKTDVSWDAAFATCASEGAHLVIVNDEVEAEILRDIMRDGGYNSYRYMWVNLRDNRPGGTSVWSPVHGQPVNRVYYGWSGSRAVGTAEWTCAVLNHDKLLYNWTCGGTTNFICEMTP